MIMQPTDDRGLYSWLATRLELSKYYQMILGAIMVSTYGLTFVRRFEGLIKIICGTHDHD